MIDVNLRTNTLLEIYLSANVFVDKIIAWYEKSLKILKLRGDKFLFKKDFISLWLLFHYENDIIVD